MAGNTNAIEQMALRCRETFSTHPEWGRVRVQIRLHLTPLPEKRFVEIYTVCKTGGPKTLEIDLELD